MDFTASAFEAIGWFQCEIPASAMTKRTGLLASALGESNWLSRWAGLQESYYAVEFDIVITLGTVELKAHVEWEEDVSAMGFRVTTSPDWSLCCTGRKEKVRNEHERFRAKMSTMSTKFYLQDPGEWHLGGLLLGIWFSHVLKSKKIP